MKKGKTKKKQPVKAVVNSWQSPIIRLSVASLIDYMKIRMNESSVEGDAKKKNHVRNGEFN